MSTRETMPTAPSVPTAAMASAKHLFRRRKKISDAPRKSNESGALVLRTSASLLRVTEFASHSAIHEFFDTLG